MIKRLKGGRFIVDFPGDHDCSCGGCIGRGNPSLCWQLPPCNMGGGIVWKELVVRRLSESLENQLTPVESLEGVGTSNVMDTFRRWQMYRHLLRGNSIEEGESSYEDDTRYLWDL